MSLLVCFILIISTGIYFYQSRTIIEQELLLQAKSYVDNQKSIILDFLQNMQEISYAIYKNPDITTYLKTGSNVVKRSLEDTFYSYALKIDMIQAIRVLDRDGNIKIFMKEGQVLSNRADYKELNIGKRDFIKKSLALNEDEMLFSNFERGKLPDTSDFCPAMIRAVMVYRDEDQILGYLVINFWGIKLGELLKKDNNRGIIPFLVEINKNNENRNGIFLFHPNAEYEFANQFGKNYNMRSVYGQDMLEKIDKVESGIFKMRGSDDYLSFNTVYPYNNKDQYWKICSIFKSDYYFKSVDSLRNNFLAIMIFSIFLSVFTSAYITRRLLSPLNRIIDAITKIGEGDLNYRINGEFKDELSVIVKTINEMADSLKKYLEEIKDSHIKIEILNRLSAIGFLSAGIAHELNTPLNSIIILCEIIAKNVEGETKNDVLLIKEEARRCVNIITNLKLLIPEKYKAEDFDTFNKKDELISLDEVVENVVKFMNISGNISFHITKEPCFILGNNNLIKIAVLNIIMNAVEAVYPKGEVRISIYSEGNSVFLKVQDNGVGISKDNMKNIFTPFFSTKKNGMGMGLPLVHKIISIHNGNISFESQYGVGTIFILELPKYDRDINS